MKLMDDVYKYPEVVDDLKVNYFADSWGRFLGSKLHGAKRLMDGSVAVLEECGGKWRIVYVRHKMVRVTRDYSPREAKSIWRRLI